MIATVTGHSCFDLFPLIAAFPDWRGRKYQKHPKACLVYCCLMNHCHNSFATPMHPIVSHRSSSQPYKWYGFYRQTSAQRHNDGPVLCRCYQTWSNETRLRPRQFYKRPGRAECVWSLDVFPQLRTSSLELWWLLLGLAVVFWIRILSWCLRGPKQYLDNDTWCYMTLV